MKALLALVVMASSASAFAPSKSLPTCHRRRACAVCSPSMLSPGEPFPADVATKLGVKGKSAVVYFYGSDGSPSCTKEADAFATALPEFRKLNVDVVGVRSDKNAQADFEQRYTQRLVKDTNDEMRQALAIKADLFGALPGRETYVIGKDGKVGLVFNNQLAAEQHATEALRAARQLSAGRSVEATAGGGGLGQLIAENSATLVLAQIVYFTAVLAWLLATR